MGRRKNRWSYTAGEKGRNRVRVFQDKDRGYRLDYVDENGVRRRPVLAPEHQTTDKAKRFADQLAATFATTERVELGPVTTGQLIEDYYKEVTKTKGDSQQRLDRLSRGLWREYLGERLSVHPSRLGRREWDGFIHARRNGLIAGYPDPVRERQVQIPISWMICVLTWGTGAVNASGDRYLPNGSPWSLEKRKGWGVQVPREATPIRKEMPDDVRELILENAVPVCRAIMELERWSRRRSSAIRRLWCSDIDFVERRVRWRGEADKRGKTIWAPMVGKMETILRGWVNGVGDVPVFPATRNPDRPIPESTLFGQLQRAKRKALASLPEEEREAMRARWHRVGFHSEKRSGIRDPRFRKLPIKVQEVITGNHWTTIVNVYDYVDAEDAREAYEEVFGRHSTGHTNRPHEGNVVGMRNG